MNTFVDVFIEDEIKITKRVYQTTITLNIRDSESAITLYFNNPETFKKFIDKLNSEIDKNTVEEYETVIESVEKHWDDVVETWMEISDVKNEITIDKNAGEL